MVAYTKPQQRKKEESGKLRGERDQIKFIHLRVGRWQVLGLRKARRRQVNCCYCECILLTVKIDQLTNVFRKT